MIDMGKVHGIELAKAIVMKAWNKATEELDRLTEQGAAAAAREHDHLIIYPLGDEQISAPSVRFMRERLGDKANTAEIPGGTHYVFYDPDPAAEDAAAEALADYAGG